MKTSLIIIPTLDIFRPKLCRSSPDQVAVTVKDKLENLVYFKDKGCNEIELESYNHFPIILNTDHSPWIHGNLYLLNKLESAIEPKSSTLESIARDLIAFKSFIDSRSINYLISPKRKLKRPTYAYRAFLQEEIAHGNLASSTASRRMSSIIGFYRWLINQYDTSFEFPLWDSTSTTIKYIDDKGFYQTKYIHSSNLKVSKSGISQSKHEFIQDGGKLRPLSKDEQRRLLQALNIIGNPEMTLAFLIALTTGARIQTVFTLRVKHIPIPKTGVNQTDKLCLKVGRGTGIDTKRQKQMNLYLPFWLVERLNVYVNSKRAKRRRMNATSKVTQSDSQYLFLTQAGNPYYLSELDPSLSSYRFPPRGGAVRKFIGEQLLPELHKSGAPFTFRFHDLRATFGVNLLGTRVQLMNKGDTSLFDVLMYVKERLGHDSITTTELYLSYGKLTKLVENIQNAYEAHLEKIAFKEL
mgnify:CR=1 FL=1